MSIILGIESSCDETSIAIIKDGELLSNVVATQIEMHQKFGGVMPELASRLHCENALFVLDEALKKANITLEEVANVSKTINYEILSTISSRVPRIFNIKKIK